MIKKYNRIIFFRSKVLINIIVTLLVYSLYITFAYAGTQTTQEGINEKADSVEIYKNVLEKAPSYLKKNIIENAIGYAENSKNEYAKQEFILQKAKLLFSQGYYLSAKDYLSKSSDDIANILGKTLGNPAEIQDQSKVFVSRPSGKKDKNSSISDSLWQDLHVEMLTMLSQAYIFLSQYGTASLVLSDMMRLYAEDTNSIIAARCYNAIGVMMARKELSEIALSYFERAIDILKRRKNKKEKDLNMLARYYSNVVSVYSLLGDFEKALKYSMESYNLLGKVNDRGEAYAHALFSMALSYSGLGQSELSEAYYKQALDYADTHGFEHLSLYIRHNYVELLMYENRWDDAYAIGFKNIKEATVLDNKTLLMGQCKNMSQIMLHKKNYKEALEWTNRVLALSDTLALTSKEEEVAFIQKQFDSYKKNQEKIQLIQQRTIDKKKIENRTLYLVLSLLIVFILVVGIGILMRRIYVQCKINNLIKSRLDHTLSITQGQMSTLKEGFEKEIELKNKELTSISLYFVKIQSLVDSLWNKVQAIKIQASARPKERMLIMEMESLLKQFNPDKNWEEFETYFQQVDKEFFNKLDVSYPNLTPNEKRLCAMVSLSLNAKEIGVLTNKAAGSVNMAKTRLKKKMGIAEEDSLYSVLTHL